MDVRRVPRWRAILCAAVLVAGAAASVPASTGHASTGHVLAIKRSTPDGRTDVIKA